MKKGTLYLFAGKMGAGKSTESTAFAQSHSFIFLSEDKLLGTLFPGEISDVAGYVNYSKRLKEALQGHLVQLLSIGQSVVLDFPANTVQQRFWLKSLAVEAGASVKLQYLECSDDICLERIKHRALQHPERRNTDTAEMFKAITAYFEVPSEDEGFDIQVCSQT